jgi:hypothetical protein
MSPEGLPLALPSRSPPWTGMLAGILGAVLGEIVWNGSEPIIRNWPAVPVARHTCTWTLPAVVVPA